MTWRDRTVVDRRVFRRCVDIVVQTRQVLALHLQVMILRVGSQRTLGQGQWRPGHTAWPSVQRSVTDQRAPHGTVDTPAPVCPSGWCVNQDWCVNHCLTSVAAAKDITLTKGQSNLAKTESNLVVPWVSKSFYPEQDLDPFSCFAQRSRVTDSQTVTDWLTYHATGSSVAIGRLIHVHSNRYT